MAVGYATLSMTRPKGFIQPGTGGEVKALLEAERRGMPFLRWRDEAGAQTLTELDRTQPRLTVGRHATCDISLPWDSRVSRTHAVVEPIGHRWTLADDGLSRNGTYLNGDRLTTRSVLAAGDTLRVGGTLLIFHDAAPDAVLATNTSESQVAAAITPMQRKVLMALCRPYKQGGSYSTPASNAEIAAELVLSVDAVKTHMRGLFERFTVGDLPQNQKRARVVELAFRTGMVSERDL